MTTYQLAKLILMAGGLESRKRVQKTVHLLQTAGCELDMDFRLHYYGPYSADLAQTLDRLTNAEILQETPQETDVGTQYNYEFNEQMLQSLESYEETDRGQVAKEEIEQYQDLFVTLCDTAPRVLELASTAVAFHEASREWDEALEKTAEFKKEPRDSQSMIKALKLAREVTGSGNDED